MKKQRFNKKMLWIIVGLILIVGTGFTVHRIHEKNKVTQYRLSIERKIEDYDSKVEENPTDVKLLMEYAIFLHDYDTLERLERSLELLERVQELSPDNPTAIGYYGSAMTKMANHLESIPDKVEYLQAGLDIMDKNVSDHPDDFSARMVRAENNYYIPEMFNRINVSVKDYEYMLKMTETGEYASMIPYLKLRLGQSYIKAERVDDAKQILQELISEYPDGNAANQAKKIIDSIK